MITNSTITFKIRNASKPAPSKSPLQYNPNRTIWRVPGTLFWGGFLPLNPGSAWGGQAHPPQCPGQPGEHRNSPSIPGQRSHLGCKQSLCSLPCCPGGLQERGCREKHQNKETRSVNWRNPLSLVDCIRSDRSLSSFPGVLWQVRLLQIKQRICWMHSHA